MRVTYTEAIDILNQSGQKFEFPTEWGAALQSEHERYLTEKVFGRPVFVTDYPKEIKAFYMRLNDDGKTVAAADMLVPGIGELIGGSQREERLDVLEARIEELGLRQKGVLVVPRAAPVRRRQARRLRHRLRAAGDVYYGYGQHPRCGSLPENRGQRGILMCGETKIMQTIEQCKEKYERYKAAGLKLDMSRGKPAADQLDLSRALLSQPGREESCLLENGLDCRNYGLPAGLPAMRALFADILGVRPENVIAGGNSSLNIMFDTVAQAYSKGVCGEKPWCSEKVKFLCPVPGYDRHFGITEYFGVEMINIPDRRGRSRIWTPSSDTSKATRRSRASGAYRSIPTLRASPTPTRRFAALRALRPKAADFTYLLGQLLCASRYRPIRPTHC